jgi:outer membrane receptor for ferrienterochelin and colicin
MKRVKVFLVSVIIAYVLVFYSGALLIAGVTGKISGVVKDKNSGQPLPGVNILVEYAQLGAATDNDGVFIILQVPPGKYALIVSYLGYGEQRIEDLRVRVDHTSIVNIDLEQKTLELGEEIVVTAKRPVVQKDVTSSTQFVSIEEIEQMPVIDTREALFLQTGVLFESVPVLGGIGGSGRGEPRYAIRGGLQDEVKWYLDGVRTSSLVEGKADRGGSFTQVNLNAIEELQVITGGFDAEYGEAQSGVVNVVTKEGGSRFSGSLEYIYSPPDQRHFGNYLYDPNTQKEYLDNIDTTKNNGSLDPRWWTDYRQRQIYDYTDLADQTVYLSLGGPLYKSAGSRGTFFISSQISEEAYIYPRPRDTQNLENILLNTAFYLGSNIKLRLSAMYNHEAHSTLQENADFTAQAKYYRGWGSLLDTYNYNLSAQLTHTLSPSMFYDIRLSRYFLDFEDTPSDFLEFGESINPNIWGFDRYDGYKDEPYDAYGFIYDEKLQTSDISLVGSLNWQANSNNLIKTGLEIRYNTYNEIRNFRYPSFSNHPDDWLNRGLHEKFHPLQIALYLQDKMEFENMILNIGVRYDYFNPNHDWFVDNSFFNLSIDPDFDGNLDPDGDQIDSNGRVKYSFENVLDKPRAAVRDYHMISPRLGISFPVTDNTVLRFNYGHFRQMPPLDRMFEFNYFRPEYIPKGYYNARNDTSITEIPHIPSTDGDPERVVFQTLEPLRPEKTIMFEAGVKHNFSNILVLDVTAYYKDVFDQNEPRAQLFDRRVYGWDPFRGQITPNTFYVSNFPGDYGDSRGFEVTIRTLFSRLSSLQLNYSFSRVTEGRASPGRIEVDEEGNMTYTYDTEVNLRIPVEKTFSRPHILRANLFFNYPNRTAGSLLNTILSNSSASILFQLVSGQSFTYVGLDDPPDTYDNQRYPAIKTVDLRLEKAFHFFRNHQFSVYARITNLLNTKNLRSFGDIFTDLEDTRNYVETGEVSTVDALGYDISWQTYYEPRRLYFGVKYGF